MTPGSLDLQTQRLNEVTMRCAICMLCAAVTFTSASFAVAAEHEASATLLSVYSDTRETACKTIKVDEEAGYSKQSCAGTQGYSLLVEDANARISVTVVGPDKREFAIDMGDKAGTGFTTLGPKAEWRVRRRDGKDAPIALIVRINETRPAKGSGPDPVISRLAVAKITADAVCLTAIIAPGKGQNERAREAAAVAPASPCLE